MRERREGTRCGEKNGVRGISGNKCGEEKKKGG